MMGIEQQQYGIADNVLTALVHFPMRSPASRTPRQRAYPVFQASSVIS